jgi:hypothetical protein
MRDDSREEEKNMIECRVNRVNFEAFFNTYYESVLRFTYKSLKYG